MRSASHHARAALSLVTFTLTLAACGGGSQATTPHDLFSPVASPSPTPSATPTTGATTPPPNGSTPTASPTVSPTPSPFGTATATAAPASITQKIDAAGHGDSDANAISAPAVAGFSGSIGYAPNNSSVVSITTTGYQGLAPGAPAPSNGASVLYSTASTLTGGAPTNQSSLVFTGNGNPTQGILTLPATATGTFTVSVYAPAFDGSNAVFTASGLTPTNHQLSFSSPFAAGIMETLPLPLTVDFELTQP